MGDSTDNHYVIIGIGDIYNMVKDVAEGNQRLKSIVEKGFSEQTIHMNNMASDVTELKEQMGSQRKELDAIKQRPTVTPKAMLQVVGAACTVVGIVVAILNLVIKP